MSGHIFISYSHASDSAYVTQLADHLATAGIRVWYDSEIIAGDRWQTAIREQVLSCAAMIVVMSPTAEQSKWVQAEIHEAEQANLPILPLLRSGKAFFGLSGLHYENVTKGTMPTDAFLSRLRSHQPPPRVLMPELLMDEEDELAIRYADALKAGAQGDHQKAADMYTTLIADWIRVAGAEDPATLVARHEYAQNLGAAGNRVEAVRLLREVIAAQTRVLGANHRQTLTSRHNLAHHLAVLGERDEAVELLPEVIANRTRMLGADHPQTLTSKHNLAHCLTELRRWDEAMRLLRDVVAGRTRVLGADHLQTLTSRHNLAYNLGRLGKRDEAVRLLREVVADRTRVQGPDHPQTGSAISWLRYLEGNQGGTVQGGA